MLSTGNQGFDQRWIGSNFGPETPVEQLSLLVCEVSVFLFRLCLPWSQWFVCFTVFQVLFCQPFVVISLFR